MKRWIATFGLAAVLSHAGLVQAEPTKELRGQIEVMLTAPEYAPTKAEWLSLGPDAARVLREVASDHKQLAVKRGRAATALSHFKSTENQQLLAQLITQRSEGWLLRGKAARSLSAAYGEQSLEAVRSLLLDTNTRLREAAVRAIASVAVPESRRILRAHLDVETNTPLRLKIERAVIEISKQLPKDPERAPQREGADQ